MLRYVLSPPEPQGEAVCCGFLHRRGGLTVDVHRGGDRGVLQALLHHIGVLAQLQQERGVRVAQPLERHAGKRRV